MSLRGERPDRPTYEILRTIEGGGVGEVREVDHLIFGRKCMQKTYSTLGIEDALACQEPRLLHSIVHPHVAEVLEAQWDPDMPQAITFVGVLYEHGSLRDALQDGRRFSLSEAIELTTQTLAALSHAHTEHGVLHRDIKPGNIFLQTPEHARLGDWGSAARLEHDGLVDAVNCTALYRAPEAGPAGARIGIPADVYAAGLSAFELLNGPFDYAAIDPLVIDRRLARGQRAVPDSALTFSPHVPGPARTAIRRACSVDPGRRPTAAQMIRELRRIESIDWRWTAGEGLQGQWDGGWPPQVSDERRRRYRVTSTPLAGGRNAGRLRLTATQALTSSGTYARFGVRDETIDAEDRVALDRFFNQVSTAAAQRVPPR
jgi:serine/threonine protein kinase